MNKGLRLTERFMQIVLSLIAIVFAGFLIGLGSLVVAKLDYVGPVPDAESLVEPAKLAPVKARMESADQTRDAALESAAQAESVYQVAKSNTSSAREALENWLATRKATLRPEYDDELITRTRDLDKLVATDRQALAAVQSQKKIVLDANQARVHAYDEYQALLRPAEEQANKVAQQAAIKVFCFRIGVTIPLLIVAAYLFKYERNSTYWPFVWGFILFALFTFFVELVPYLPSYGGFVRYGVGILLTISGGHYAIRWLQRWLERQKAAEALPAAQRRTSMRYNVAIQRIGKSVCPSCERPTNFKDEHICHCPHCGIGLFDRCPACSSRKNAFARFCFSCGTPANASLAD
jgi:hypothetical protein